MKKSFTSQRSLLSVITTAFTIAGILISVVIITILYNNFKRELRDELKNRLSSITAIASLQQDGDKLLNVTSRNDEHYNEINKQNLEIRSADPDLVYVYTMRKNDQGIYFVVDANLPNDEGIADFGQLYEEPSPTLADNFDTLNQTIIEPDFYTDEFGTFLSAYAPIRDSDGRIVGVLGIDIAANDIVAKERQFLIQSLIVFLISLPIIALLGYFLGKQITTPITRLTASAVKIASGDLNEKAVEITGSKEAGLLAASFNNMTQELSILVNNLESQVAERTKQLEKRANQLNAISSVARSTASLQDLEDLLPAVTLLVSERFDFYHSGIFLIDDSREFAVLRAANSEGGKRMLARQHQLKLNENSIVGFVTSRGEPRIALDVGADAVYFDNPDLPDTRSEMALPLRIGGRVIGAMDVQSKEANAFSDADVSILSTLADQVSIAIENALLFSESREALKRTEETFSQYVKQEWSSFAKQTKTTGYKFDGSRTIALDMGNSPKEVKETTKTGSLSLETDLQNISIPVKFRGQVIGVLDVISKNGNRKWSKDDLALLEAAAERTAIALENTRLVESSQRRASRERTIGEISSRIGTVSDVESIMQAAVEELGRKIGGAAEVTLELDQNDYS